LTVIERARPRSGHGSIAPHRDFDPRRVGTLECAVWIAYYRRAWPTFLHSTLMLTRHVFGLPWPQTVRAAWLVLRANQLWAPYPHNEPERARHAMQRFYALVKQRHHERFDPAQAARLEVEWWRVHREHQHTDDPAADERPLVDALAALYSYVYDVGARDVLTAAEQRALAMRFSDQWVREGRQRDSALVDLERAALVRSYAGLLAGVHR
jgi:hypothetical protein